MGGDLAGGGILWGRLIGTSLKIKGSVSCVITRITFGNKVSTFILSGKGHYISQ